MPLSRAGDAGCGQERGALPDGPPNPAAGPARGSAAFAFLVCNEFTNPLSTEKRRLPPGETDGCRGIREAVKAEGVFLLLFFGG